MAVELPKTTICLDREGGLLHRSLRRAPGGTCCFTYRGPNAQGQRKMAVW